MYYTFMKTFLHRCNIWIVSTLTSFDILSLINLMYISLTLQQSRTLLILYKYRESAHGAWKTHIISSVSHFTLSTTISHICNWRNNEPPWNWWRVCWRYLFNLRNNAYTSKMSGVVLKSTPRYRRVVFHLSEPILWARVGFRRLTNHRYVDVEFVDEMRSQTRKETSRDAVCDTD